MILLTIAIVTSLVAIVVAAALFLRSIGKLWTLTAGFTILAMVAIVVGVILFAFRAENKKEAAQKAISNQEKIEELRNNTNIVSTKSYYLPEEPISLESAEYAIVKTKAYYSFDFYPINGYPNIDGLRWERIGWDSNLELYDIKVWNEGKKVEFKTIEYLK